MALQLQTRAQVNPGNLEFIENKGQWDTAMNFRADLPNGNFFLQKHGFSVLLQNADDMDAVRLFMHGHSSGTTNTASHPSGTSENDVSPIKKAGGNNGHSSSTDGELTIHSHLY